MAQRLVSCSGRAQRLRNACRRPTALRASPRRRQERPLHSQIETLLVTRALLSPLIDFAVRVSCQRCLRAVVVVFAFMSQLLDLLACIDSREPVMLKKRGGSRLKYPSNKTTAQWVLADKGTSKQQAHKQSATRSQALVHRCRRNSRKPYCFQLFFANVCRASLEGRAQPQHKSHSLCCSAASRAVRRRAARVPS